MSFPTDSMVRHPRFGAGKVMREFGELTLVEFTDGNFQRVRTQELHVVSNLVERLQGTNWDPPLPTLLKAAALAIRSTNDRWGVFAPTRIQLLPHQLWVCRKVLERWPSSWLVADDVGLGKTIEAGLIITPLLASHRVKRLLVLAPASLVEQWQERMLKMFGVGLSKYSPEADTPKSGYWNSNHRVIASLQTLRRDSQGRWDRMLAAPPWDLVLVDEAHHLNAGEDQGATLAFQLLHRMRELRRIRSMVFFTGTPHRGKTYGFFALMSLLRPDLFNPSKPIEQQLPYLKEAMIRNNKQQVTGMDGQRLFSSVEVFRHTYHYSREEREFYNRLSAYIASGRAFASRLSEVDQRRAMLVLITMQKLASSSVAAIRRALGTRLQRLRRLVNRAQDIAQDLLKVEEGLERLSYLKEEADASTADLRAQQEELVAELVVARDVNPAELETLEELISLADAVGTETKVELLLDLLDSTYTDCSVLIFTEYKATQALVMSALQRRFGDGCVGFINGDEAIEGVVSAKGQKRNHRMSREAAAEAFNEGTIRFLVSTEAAGEGIDLQKNCHTLCHADLPWNPMRLHQRVGRVSRFGQQKKVDVFHFLNLETVEGQIWQRLFEKLQRITAAFQSAMEDPEDMMQAVLGMSTPGFFEGVFSDAPPDAISERLEQWFDAKTSTFGGKEATHYVQEVFGNVAKFQFGVVAKDLPQVDLPDLLPFFRGVLAFHQKLPKMDGNVVSFNMPSQWIEKDPLLPNSITLRFCRDQGKDGYLAGVGTRYVDIGLEAALDRDEKIAVVPNLDSPLAVMMVEEKLSGGEGVLRRVVFGVEKKEEVLRLLADWELLVVLNRCLSQPFGLARTKEEGLKGPIPAASEFAGDAEVWLKQCVPSLGLPFEVPEVELGVIFWPSRKQEKEGVAE